MLTWVILHQQFVGVMESHGDLGHPAPTVGVRVSYADQGHPAQTVRWS